MNRLAIAAVLALMVGAAPASGQILGGARPSLPTLPSAPTGPSVRDLPGTDAVRSSELGQTLEGTVTGARDLAEAREARLESFVQANADIVETDDRGWPVLRGEVTAVSPTAAALKAAEAAGFRIRARERLDELGLELVTLVVPNGMAGRRALKRLRKLDPAGTYELNHLYEASGSAARLPLLVGAGPAAAVAPGLRVGLIDTGVAQGHPALAGSRIEQRGFAAGGVAPQPHGTATASLLVGRAGGFKGAAPGARLYVADVYGPGRGGGAATSVAKALAWMARERVPVINVSLVGPDDLALRAAVQAMVARGHLVVAAVGNDGPAAPPLYPASYAGAVAVTGVDARARVLPEAGRARVDFAAPGADMAAAQPAAGWAAVRGTSFAAPLVAGRLAQMLSAPDAAAAKRAVDTLSHEARDLGSRGRDKIYGWGLVGADLRTPPAALNLRTGRS
jgi:hypothetical protein